MDIVIFGRLSRLSSDQIRSETFPGFCYVTMSAEHDGFDSPPELIQRELLVLL